MGSFFQFIAIFLFIGLFLITVPCFFIVLIFLESLLFGIKRIQTIKLTQKFIKHHLETESCHHLMAKALSINCGNKTIKVPFYLVNAYLFIGQGDIYEIDPKTNTLLRIFSYNPETDRINVLSKRGSMGNKDKKVVHLVSDLEPTSYHYMTYLPEGISR